MAKKYSFKQFLTEKIELIQEGDEEVKTLKIDKVIIPMIQRDYAQGRKFHTGKNNAEELNVTGKKFINEIFNKLASSDSDTMDLDFIYGSIDKDGEKNIFYPLDGQQRLTTLFLLYWFLGGIELDQTEKDKLSDLLVKFFYMTRTSSTRFCEKLASELKLNSIDYQKKVINPEDKTEENITSEIKNLSWFHDSFLQDPTIIAMLNMLEEIQRLYLELNKKELYKRLELLNFYILPLNHFNLTEDLYVKMNARGKQLTDFENFKADLQHWLKDPKNISLDDVEYDGRKLPYHMAFINKIDNEWTNCIWNISKKENGKKVADPLLMLLFFRYFHSLYILSSDTVNKEIDKEENFYRLLSEGHYSDFKLFSSLLTKDSITNLEKMMDSFTTNFDDIQKGSQPSWYKNSEKKFNIFESKMGINERVIFLAIILYLQKNTYNSVKFKNWMRIVWNIVRNSYIDSWKSAIGTMTLIEELAVHSDDIYSWFADDNFTVTSKNAKEQVAEEVQKSKLIKVDEAWEQCFIDAESHPFFEGNISFFIPDEPTIDTYKHNAEMAYCFFEDKGIALKYRKEGHLMLRALISRYKTFEEINNNNFTDIDEKEHFLKKKLQSDEVIRTAIKEWFSLPNEDAIYKELQKEVNKESAIPVEGNDFAKKMHESLYQSSDLQNWMQENHRIRVRHGYVSRASSWYDWIYLYGYRNEIATELALKWNDNSGFCSLKDDKKINFFWCPAQTKQVLLKKKETIKNKEYLIECLFSTDNITVKLLDFDKQESIAGIEDETFNYMEKVTNRNLVSSFVSEIEQKIEEMKQKIA